MILDITKCYEHVDRLLLAAEAEWLKAPMTAVRLALRAYGWDRLVSFGHMVKQVDKPALGIVAGCAFATTLLRMYLLRALDKAVEEFPEEAEDFSVFIDDLIIAGTCDKPGQLVQALLRAVEALLGALERRKLSVAAEKVATTASKADVVVSFWVEVSRVSQLPGGLGDTPVLSLVGLQPAGAAAGQRETKYETVCFDASSE